MLFRANFSVPWELELTDVYCTYISINKKQQLTSAIELETQTENANGNANGNENGTGPEFIKSSQLDSTIYIALSQMLILAQ